MVEKIKVTTNGNLNRLANVTEVRNDFQRHDR